MIVSLSFLPNDFAYLAASFNCSVTTFCFSKDVPHSEHDGEVSCLLSPLPPTPEDMGTSHPEACRDLPPAETSTQGLACNVFLFVPPEKLMLLVLQETFIISKLGMKDNNSDLPNTVIVCGSMRKATNGFNSSY